jgi:hypothetical protein
VARKQNRVPIDHPDTGNTDPAYWERVLASHGLSPDRAYQPRNLVYVGDSKNLANVEESQNRNIVPGGRRVSPKGPGPDR